MRKIALFAVVAVAAVGCKPSPEKQIVGNWKVTDVQLPGPVASSPMAATLKSQLSGATLEMKADKKYSLSIAGQPIAGEWTISERTASLQPKTYNGKSAADIQKEASKFGGGAMTATLTKASTATLGEDGKTLDADVMGMKFKFAKSGE